MQKRNGFTLIELMVVIVIIGILVAIALPNFIAAEKRAKMASVKANAKSLQTIIETYNIDYGIYPNSVSSIVNSQGYKSFKNPFTGFSGVANMSGYDGAWRTTRYGSADSPGDLTDNFSEGGPNARGLVLYQGLNNNLNSTTSLFDPDGNLSSANPQQTTSYLIIGCTDLGRPILRFVLNGGGTLPPKSQDLLDGKCWSCIQ